MYFEILSGYFEILSGYFKIWSARQRWSERSTGSTELVSGKTGAAAAVKQRGIWVTIVMEMMSKAMFMTTMALMMLI